VSANVKDMINDSILDIDTLFDTYELLFDHVKQKAPDAIELAAIATVIHSFYNGIENVFLLISKNIDKHTPSTDRWHKELLTQMATYTDKRIPVISENSLENLAQYMQFRHFFRHAYSFQLSWDKTSPLVENIQTVWYQTKNELKKFLDNID
jgi:hypothetical protein